MSADHEYVRAQTRWKECIDISVHDDEACIAPVAASLERCLDLEPEHVPALRLLGYLSMQRGAVRESQRCVRKILRLLPADEMASAQLELLKHGTRDQRLDWVESRWRGDWSGPFPVRVGGWHSSLPAFPLTDEETLATWLAGVPAVAEKLMPRLFQRGKGVFRPDSLEELEKELPPAPHFYEELNDPLRHACSWLAGEIFRRRHKGKWVVQVDYPRYDDFGLPEVKFADNASLCFFMLLGGFGPDRDGGSLLEFFQSRPSHETRPWSPASQPVPYDGKHLDLVRLESQAQFDAWLNSMPQLVRRGIRGLAEQYRDRLDYSAGSLDVVEKLVSLTPPFGSSLLFSEKWLERTVWVAAYVGEVARRRYPSWDWRISFSRRDANRGIPYFRPKANARLFPLLLVAEFADRRKPGFLRKSLDNLGSGEAHAHQ